MKTQLKHDKFMQVVFNSTSGSWEVRLEGNLLFTSRTSDSATAFAVKWCDDHPMQGIFLSLTNQFESHAFDWE